MAVEPQRSRPDEREAGVIDETRGRGGIKASPNRAAFGLHLHRNGPLSLATAESLWFNQEPVNAVRVDVSQHPRALELDPGTIEDPGTRLLRLFGVLQETLGDGVAKSAVDRPYREFLEALAVAVYTTDADGRITFFNQAAVDLWGRQPKLGEEWCGSLRLFRLDGEPLRHDECPMAIALKENRPVRGATAVAERPDGGRVAFVPYPTPLRDPHGTMIGAVNVLVDVTERVEAEDALRQTAEALRASNAVKDEFLGLISHELRTPVTSIFGNAVLLRDRDTSGDLEQSMIRDISEDSERLLRIVENLLQLTRLTAGTALDLEPQVLDHVVRGAVASYLRRHPERHIAVSIGARSAIVDGDSTALELVIENLLSNADKYSPASETIDVRLVVDAGEAALSVLDRGIGISDADSAEVFTTFFRTRAARQSASGMGVGLAVCKRIVEAQGGRVWAAAREGGGADVGFALPCNRDLDEDVSAAPN